MSTYKEIPQWKGKFCRWSHDTGRNCPLMQGAGIVIKAEHVFRNGRDLYCIRIQEYNGLKDSPRLARREFSIEDP